MKGMIILREPVKEETGHELLQNLAKLWEHFFSNILPLLQAIFYPIETLNCSVRSLTLISFRDIVVLKTKLEDALMEKDVFVPPRIQQMLLVLQSIRSNPPSENFIKLESIVALVVSPYLKPSQLSHTIPSPNKHFKRSTGYMNRSRHRTQTEGYPENGETLRQTDRHTHRHRETDRQTDRLADRQTFIVNLFP
jgi:hypothetical protein